MHDRCTVGQSVDSDIVSGDDGVIDRCRRGKAFDKNSVAVPRNKAVSYGYRRIAALKIENSVLGISGHDDIIDECVAREIDPGRTVIGYLRVGDDEVIQPVGIRIYPDAVAGVATV